MESAQLKTPVGNLALRASALGVVSIDFARSKKPVSRMPYKNIHLKRALQQLKEYFNGSRLNFSFALDPQGTAFQKKVWKALTEIPFGATSTYGEVAKKIGNPKAARAIGMANNQNPLPIAVPCHRVIGKSGELVGYAGGIRTKKWLLTHEKIVEAR